MRLLIFLIGILIFKSSCDSASVESDAIKLVGCDYKDRATTEKVSNLEATVTYLNNEGSIIVLVPMSDKTKRFAACNLPDVASKKDGTVVIISADIKEIKPNERWAGTPIELTKLKIKAAI
jgi:hypothetical protein